LGLEIDAAPGGLPWVQTTRPAHLLNITACVFSPDERSMMWASRDGALMFWKALTQAHQTILRAHFDGINACAFSSDERS